MSAGYIGAAVLAAVLIGLVVKKMRHGGSCCGEREGPVGKQPAGDRNPAHYPYRYRVGIEGMVCGNCARTVENAFHQKSGIYAHVDLGKKNARVLSKRPLKREDAVDILKGTSYTVLDFKEETI